MAFSVYIALIHYPVVNREGRVITSAVTNMDIHDLSRTARTYSIKRVFLVTPVPEQHVLVDRILGHWMGEPARTWHPKRVEAVSRVELAKDFSEVKARVSAWDGQSPEVLMPDARELQGAVSYSELRSDLGNEGRTRPVILVFGTAWGIAPEFYTEVDRFLLPIYGPEGKKGYNHLSVRAAAAAVLDRIFGS